MEVEEGEEEDEEEEDEEEEREGSMRFPVTFNSSSYLPSPNCDPPTPLETCQALPVSSKTANTIKGPLKPVKPLQHPFCFIQDSRYHQKPLKTCKALQFPPCFILDLSRPSSLLRNLVAGHIASWKTSGKAMGSRMDGRTNKEIINPYVHT